MTSTDADFVTLFAVAVAVIVAVVALADTPVTSPLAFTVAIEGSLDNQVIVAPVTGFSFASSASAVSCDVPPARTVVLPEIAT
jgi:hypothetical protein